jgi:hypothetical protein
VNSILKIFLFFRLPGALILLCALSGCASQRRVVVGLSPDLEDYYAIYPSIEFDVVAVTGEEEAQIKSDGVDKYFAPGSPLRRRLDPFTVYFSQERTVPATLYFRSDYWDKWLKKKPVTLVLIANLPHSPECPRKTPGSSILILKRTASLPGPFMWKLNPKR